MANSILIQKQIKDNADDLHNFVRDLKLWEEDMKRKDRQLNSGQNSEEILPPVRKAKISSKTPSKNETLNKEEGNVKKRIPSYDYKSWDTFDVDKACEDIDYENMECENDDGETAEQKEKYLREKALYEKELGNKHVKSCKWDAALEAYSKAISAYPKDPIFFANRALCHLKKKRWGEVETDCTEALKLDSTYVKAYLRRAVAREALGRLEDAKHDLREVLRLEPGNTQAFRELQRLNTLDEKKRENFKKGGSKTNQSTNLNKPNELISSVSPLPQPSSKTDTGNKSASISESNKIIESSVEPQWEPSCSIIHPISKPPHLRSKKSLKCIEIHDIGFNAPKHVCLRKSLIVSKQDTPLHPECPKPPNIAPSEAKPRSNLTLAGARSVPPPPKTSVQFHKYWSSIKDDSHLCYKFLKQIPGEELAEIFKESLESCTLSKILETLAVEGVGDEEGQLMLPYLQGLTTIRRFSTLTLFLSPADKINLIKLFQHCTSRGECTPSDIETLRRQYEF